MQNRLDATFAAMLQGKARANLPARSIDSLGRIEAALRALEGLNDNELESLAERVAERDFGAAYTLAGTFADAAKAQELVEAAECEDDRHDGRFCARGAR